MQRPSSRSGFTLVELIVCIGIIVVFLTVSSIFKQVFWGKDKPNEEVPVLNTPDVGLSEFPDISPPEDENARVSK